MSSCLLYHEGTKFYCSDDSRWWGGERNWCYDHRGETTQRGILRPRILLQDAEFVDIHLEAHSQGFLERYLVVAQCFLNVVKLSEGPLFFFVKNVSKGVCIPNFDTVREIILG